MLFLPGYFSKVFSTKVSMDGKHHAPCKQRDNKHRALCGKDACPHLPQAAALLAYKGAAEESLLFLCQLWASEHINTALQGTGCREEHPDASCEVLAAIQERTMFPSPFLPSSSSHTSTLCKDQSAKRRMNRSGGKALGSPSPSAKWQQMVEALLYDRWRNQ